MLYNERMLLSKHNTSQMSHAVDERDLLAGFIVINIIRLRWFIVCISLEVV